MTSKSDSAAVQPTPQAKGNNPSVFTIRKRTAFIYTIAIVLAACATVEWLGQYGYSHTVARLRSISKNGESVLTLATVREEFAAGFPVEHVVKVGGKTVSLL